MRIFLSLVFAWLVLTLCGADKLIGMAVNEVLAFPSFVARSR